jgi:protein-S-isoprenylcysteine O-methyltransferase Ste14
MKNRYVQLFGGLLSVLAAIAALPFVPAGTLDYWQAWAFLAVWGVSSIVVGLYLVVNDPALWERRMKVGPAAMKTSERIVLPVLYLAFCAIFVIAGLDHRFHWSAVPASIAIAGDVLVALGWTIIFLVFKENTFAAPTVQVTADQKLTSTGPYAIVRHPMYAGSLLYLLGMPVALASWWPLLAIVLFVPVGAWRMFNEETVLTTDLVGYSDYKNKVRYRLKLGGAGRPVLGAVFEEGYVAEVRDRHTCVESEHNWGRGLPVRWRPAP